MSELLKEETKTHKTGLTVDEERTFLDYLQYKVKFKRWYPLFLLLFRTGIRIGEALALTWDDVDFKNSILSISKTVSYFYHTEEGVHKFEVHPPKSEAGRRKIPMTPELKEVLFQFKQDSRVLKDTFKPENKKFENYIFRSCTGCVLAEGNINMTIKRIILGCNDDIMSGKFNGTILPPFTCHITRHTFATRINEAGVNIKTAQKILGHAHFTTTMDIYTAIADSFVIQELNSYADYVWGYRKPEN